jgi:adenylate cyclase
MAAGLTLFAYVTTHLINISLGLISLDVLESGRSIAVSIWRSPALWIVAPGALLTHIGLALYSMLNRRTFKKLMWWEFLQAGLAHLIPVFLLAHLAQTRTMSTLRGVDDTYGYLLSGGTFGVWFLLGLLLVAWAHGNIGVHAWLRLRPWYRKAFWPLATFSLALPMAATAGIIKAQLEVNALARDPNWLREMAATQPMARAEYDQEVLVIYLVALAIVLGCVALAYVARACTGVLWRRGGSVAIQFSTGEKVEVSLGTSVLEASRIAGIAHSSVCGGRGRCSTCRVRVYHGHDTLPKPTRDEGRLLERIGASDHVRIACQLYPTTTLVVAPILDAYSTTAAAGFAGALAYDGREEHATIMFADLRGFTAIAEHRLAFDTVHILNQYFAVMGDAITLHHGTIDKIMGDGIMAIFEGDRESARNALAAVHEMTLRLKKLNDLLASELDSPLEMGVGLHCGVVVIGPLGYGKTRAVTAIGDAVNTSSRLEGLTKELACSVVVSDEVLQKAGILLQDLPRRDIVVRGRSMPISVVAIDDTSGLADELSTD